ncbi:MAG TPA: type II toxin-antitoxin system death-on-curing family toxin [Opitutaceae bacterium]|jgi:death-on-curing protein
MKKPVWVLRETVHALHERLLSEFGGATGVRDNGMLESALTRPENQYAYGSSGMPELAAAYAFGLVRNHPFVDGNKRIGFATAILFLELNGYHFTASEVDATVQTLALAAHELDESGYATWLASNSRSAKIRSKSRKAPR